ncbi:MAG TPA: hypothetical protein PKN04_16355 [bacterium]|nr:hypothetical protein [bacterium]HNT67359.1 hypothetical protein [bacterium]
MTGAHEIDQVKYQQAGNRELSADFFVPPGHDHANTNSDWKKQQANPFIHLDMRWMESLTNKKSQNQSNASQHPYPGNPSHKRNQQDFSC